MNNALYHLYVLTLGHTHNAETKSLLSSASSDNATDDAQFLDPLIRIVLGNNVLFP